MTEYESVIQKGPATKAEERRERAVLVGVERPGLPWPLESSLAELERLADTAGADVVATTTQRLDAPNPRTFVGTGKADEIAELARSHEADLVIFDDELTPSQQANLEKVMDKSVKVIDRTALIPGHLRPARHLQGGASAGASRPEPVLVPAPARHVGPPRFEPHGRRRGIPLR